MIGLNMFGQVIIGVEIALITNPANPLDQERLNGANLMLSFEMRFHIILRDDKSCTEKENKNHKNLIKSSVKSIF